MPRVDLHCHSSFSDGSLDPERLAAALAERGVQYAALTDHGSLEGCERFRRAMASRGIGTVDGMEVSSLTPFGEVHLLAYAADPGVRESLAGKALGGDARRGFERALHEERDPGPDILSAEEALWRIKAAGATAFLAHPLTISRESEVLERLVSVLAGEGLDGIEAVYASYGPEERSMLTALAARHGLLVCAGSDWHSPADDALPPVELDDAQWKAFRDAVLGSSPAGDGGPRPLAAIAPRPRVKRRRRAPAVLRLGLPALLVAALFLASTFAFIIPEFERGLLELEKKSIREVTQTAMGILEEYAAEVERGSLSLQDAQQGAAERIKGLRYGKEGKDYLWITDATPRMVMHPYRPELDGRDLSEYRDDQGVLVFTEFVRVVELAGSGYVEYRWQWEDDASRVVPKLSFVELFRPWGWILGTGVYLDGVAAEISGMRSRILAISAAILVLLTAILALMVLQGIKAERERSLAEAAGKELQERYRSIVEMAPEGMCVVAEGRITFSNGTLRSMTGFDAEGLPLLRVSELLEVAGEDREAASSFIASLSPGALPGTPPGQPFSCLLRRREGPRLPVIVQAAGLISGGREAWVLSMREAQGAKDGFPRPAASAEARPWGRFRLKMGRQGRFLEADDAARRILGPEALEKGLFASLKPQGRGLSLHDCLAADSAVARLRARIEDGAPPPKEVLITCLLTGNEGEDAVVEGLVEDIGQEAAHEERAQALLRETLLLGSEPGPALRESGIASETSVAAAIAGAAVLGSAGGSPRLVLARLSDALDRAIRAWIDRGIAELGPPPCRFAWLALGSLGRAEAMPGSDRDSALVYEDGAEGAEAYFLALARGIGERLGAAGLAECAGGQDAAKPAWCRSLSGWKRVLASWFESPGSVEIPSLCSFLDFRAVGGDPALGMELDECIGELGRERPALLSHLALASRDHWLSSETPREAKELKAAAALIPYVARAYALRDGLQERNSFARLEALEDSGVLGGGLGRESARAQELLLGARLRREAQGLNASLPPRPRGPEEGKIEEACLKAALAQAATLKKRFAFDFLGGAGFGVI